MISCDHVLTNLKIHLSERNRYKIGRVLSLATIIIMIIGKKL